MEITIFTPIEMVEKLFKKKGESDREHINRCLEATNHLRLQPTLFDSKHLDYLEIMRLYHKHTVPAAINNLMNILQIRNELSQKSRHLSSDLKNFLIVKLRLLHFLNNLSQKVLNEKANFIQDSLVEFSNSFKELFTEASIKTFLSMQLVTSQYNDEIFSKISHAFTSILWLQFNISPTFQKLIKIPDNDAGICAIEFWKIIFHNYESFNHQHVEYLAKLCQYCLEKDPNFLCLYSRFVDKSDKANLLIFLHDYIETYVCDIASNELSPHKLSLSPFLTKCLCEEFEQFKLCDPGHILDEPSSKQQFSLVASIIKCLCLLLKQDMLRDLMKDERCLLKSVINLGLYIKRLEEIDPINFKPINKLKDSENNSGQDGDDPRIDLKTRIIKLIGNLVSEHPTNQDIVRNCDGLAFILDCTQIDERNSFIQQWSVFAINNAVKNNVLNQQYIASITKKDHKSKQELFYNLKENL